MEKVLVGLTDALWLWPEGGYGTMGGSEIAAVWTYQFVE